MSSSFATAMLMHSEELAPSCDGRSSAIRCRLGTTRLIPPKKRRARQADDLRRAVSRLGSATATRVRAAIFLVLIGSATKPLMLQRFGCRAFASRLIPENRRYRQHQYEPSFRNPKGFGDTVGKYFPEGQYEGEFGRFYARVRKGNSDCNRQRHLSPGDTFS